MPLTVEDNEKTRKLYFRAIQELDTHVKPKGDGTFVLNIDEPPAGVEAQVFNDLGKSLEETNSQIKTGKLKTREVEKGGIPQ